jgi:hypothetical protein
VELKAGQRKSGLVVFDIPKNALKGGQIHVSSIWDDESYGYWSYDPTTPEARQPSHPQIVGLVTATEVEQPRSTASNSRRIRPTWARRPSRRR